MPSSRHISPIPARYLRPRGVRAAVAVDQRYLGAETAEGLREFQSDINLRQDQEMFRM